MKKLAIALGVALFATGILYIGLLRASHDQRQQTGELEARLTALQAARPQQSAFQAAAQPPGSVEAAGAGGDAGSAIPAGGPRSGAGDADSLATISQQLMNSEEGREFTRNLVRMGMEEQYPDVAKELGLNAEEVDKLFDLLARRMTDLGMGRLSAQSASNTASREEMGRRLAEQEQAFEGELASLLGGRYPQWKEYQRTAGERQRQNRARQGMERLRSAVSPAGNALNDAQFQALNAALDAEEKRIGQESRGRSMQQELQRMPETHRRLIDVASGHLNAQQLEGYRRYLQQQADMARAMSDVIGGRAGE